MTQSTSYDKNLIISIIQQLRVAIEQIRVWNSDVDSADYYACSQDGMKTLAATSMLLEAIGESVKKIDSRTKGTLLSRRPDIPWTEIMAMRNHIAHGYFDIDAELVFDVVNNDIDELDDALGELLSFL